MNEPVGRRDAEARTLTLTQRAVDGDRELAIAINRSIVVVDSVDYETEQPPHFGWMRWDSVPVDWDQVIADVGEMLANVQENDREVGE